MSTTIIEPTTAITLTEKAATEILKELTKK